MSDDAVPISPRDLLRKVRIATFDAGAEMRAGAEEHARRTTGGRLSCRRGCDNCCRQKVLATSGEGLAIFLHLQVEGLWTPELEAALEMEDQQATATAHDEWFRYQLPCPFLADDGSCGVYPVRPVGCLATFSAGNSAECGVPQPAPGHGQFQVNSTEPATRALAELLFSIDRGLPGGAVYMTLPGAVLAGYRHARGLPPRRALSVPIGLGAEDPIERFDAEGKKMAAEDLAPCGECGAEWVPFNGGDAGLVHMPGCSENRGGQP